jgi:hypothetical protein
MRRVINFSQVHLFPKQLHSTGNAGRYSTAPAPHDSQPLLQEAVRALCLHTDGLTLTIFWSY